MLVHHLGILWVSWDGNAPYHTWATTWVPACTCLPLYWACILESGMESWAPPASHSRCYLPPPGIQESGFSTLSSCLGGRIFYLPACLCLPLTLQMLPAFFLTSSCVFVSGLPLLLPAWRRCLQHLPLPLLLPGSFSYCLTAWVLPLGSLFLLQIFLMPYFVHSSAFLQRSPVLPPPTHSRWRPHTCTWAWEGRF